MTEKFKSPYQDYDVLDKWDTPSWNEQTRKVVGRRLGEVPQRKFLTEDEWRTVEAVCARLIPQPDRSDEPVPIPPFIDQKLERNQGEGYRYEDMPPLREAWRKGLSAIEQESNARHGARFADLGSDSKDALLADIQEARVQVEEAWHGLPPAKFFSETMLKTVVGIYYSHPSAWSEIGYGGPASPRGYVRLGADQRDPWEAEEQREQE